MPSRLCHVADNMLPTRLKLLPQIAATFLLFALAVHTTPTRAATRYATNVSSTAATATVAATAAATATSSVDGDIIGATSLAAAAGAAAAIAGDLSMARSSGAGGSNELIGNSANLLLEELQHAATSGHIVNLTRHHDGDVFHTNGVTSCNADTCVGLSSGTAGLVRLGGDRSDAHSRSSAVGAFTSGNGQRQLHTRGLKTTAAAAATKNQGGGGESCQCRCMSYLSTYREDLGICVDDVHECMLSPFVSGSSSEKIPFVFLPLRGQIIYPSREISFPDIRTPVCAVTGAQYLTSNGWSDLRNPIDTDYPFRMFRDEGRTFLQWLGETDLRQKMQGRLIVVHLVCRDMTIALNATAKEHIMPPKNVFSPCVAFRVNGSPVKYFHNVSEVLFQAEATSTLASTSDGMSTKEYVVIGVCSLLLGLIYVSSVFLYLHMKKRKNRDQSHKRNSLDDLTNEINYPKNDQVTFGAPFNRSGSLYSATSLGTANANEPRSRNSIGSLKEEMGIIKNNPLLQHFPQLSDHHSGGFASDISNSNSECEMDGPGGVGGGGGGGYHDKLKQMQTAALVHPQLGMNSNGSANGSHGNSANGSDTCDNLLDPSVSPTQETQERLPEENVAIVEDMMTEEKLENLRAMVNGNVRRKLYFNPAYFEPQLLAQPPPAAVEFLQKIREVIAIAKYKMATKRYQPSLIMIPEEGALRSNTPSVYSSQMQTTSAAECLGCANNRCSGHVKNCGDKRNSIEKWLQSVPTTDEHKEAGKTSSTNSGDDNKTAKHHATRPQSHPGANNPERHSSSAECTYAANRGSPRREITPPKQRPPPPPAPNNKSNLPSKSSIIEITHSDALPPMDNSPQLTYQQYCTSITTRPSHSIPVNRNYDGFSALSAAANIYGFAETGGEIYNNPKFTLHDSPAASQRSHSSSHRSKSSRKRLDVLDHYAAASTPTSLTSSDRQHYKMLRNMKQMPDMVYDAITRDYNSTLTTNGSYHMDIPTPDYDSTMEKKIKDIYNNTQSSAPSVPTPDYSTLSRKSLKHCQPDSPIYRRKSPQYLIVDYETDSLERLEATKRKSSQSSSSPSSDVSSQLSPSLSTALPLEEELEISHTVYDKMDGFRKEGDLKKKLVTKSDSGASKQKEIAARIKYDTPFRGSMTIEVEHEPQSDIERSTDSDQFEPDTLDRKPKKQSFCDVNSWSVVGGQLKKQQPNYGHDEAEPYSTTHLNNMNSLPELGRPASFMLRPSHSFRDQGIVSPTYESHVEMRVHPNQASSEVNEELRANFNHLREIYQSPLVRQNSQQSCKCGGQTNQHPEPDSLEAALTEQGRLLTLEAKHTRRQRLIEPPESPSPPEQVVEISTKVSSNRTTIKISTPKVNRATETAARIEPQQLHNGISRSPSINSNTSSTKLSKSSTTKSGGGIYDVSKNWSGNAQHAPPPPNTPASTLNSSVNKLPVPPKKRAARSPPPPPPPPPTASASTTLTSQRSQASSGRHSAHLHYPHYQNHGGAGGGGHHYMHTNSTALTNEEETMSNHSESTEITGVSDTIASSEFEGSCNNTLSSVAAHYGESGDTGSGKLSCTDAVDDCPSSRRSSVSGKLHAAKKLKESPVEAKKLKNNDYGAMFNTQINGLRSDYSLTKYLNRRKTQDNEDEPNCGADLSAQETNNNKNLDMEINKLDVLSISSRSNRSSSRLSDRTKEMYRNAGVPVGIAYPQRSSAGNSNSVAASAAAVAATAATSVQTVYRCEIEPVQLTHGMQIAMGLKDRAKKAKDLKNAWKKFVSMAAAKFSPTQSPAPPFDHKKTPSFLEVLDRDEGISSLIDEQPKVLLSSPKSSYSAPASQNYYEQRFGARPGEMDSGYMSADSSEVYKRSFYDRYNFKMMSGRDHIIRVDTIEDNSDGGSTLTDRHNGVQASARRGSILDSNRFEDFEHMGEPPAAELAVVAPVVDEVASDAESDKTLTRSDGRSGDGGGGGGRSGTRNVYSSEDEQGHSPSYGSSETDGETNAEDMWESGAESIETHSVLYKNVRKN